MTEPGYGSGPASPDQPGYERPPIVPGQPMPPYGSGYPPPGQPMPPYTPGYPPPGQPYAQYPPAPMVAPPKKRKTGRIILIVLGAVLAVCIGGAIIAVATGGGGGSSGGNAAVGMRQAGRDGKFEFVVSDVTCGAKSVGGSFGQKAQGQFCIVHLTIKNIGNEGQLFDASQVFAFNAAGQKYNADGAASLDENQGTQAFLNNINPGNTVTGAVVFDIPVGQAITKLELHDSPFSGGVTVNVS